jgi:hypothetical protein
MECIEYLLRRLGHGDFEGIKGNMPVSAGSRRNGLGNLSGVNRINPSDFVEETISGNTRECLKDQVNELPIVTSVFIKDVLPA